jgi:hypothetical protein
MKTYGGVNVWIQVFFTSTLVGGEWSTSRPGRFTPRERASSTHWIGGWVGPRTGLDVEKRKFLTLPGLELQKFFDNRLEDRTYTILRKIYNLVKQDLDLTKISILNANNFHQSANLNRGKVIHSSVSCLLCLCRRQSGEQFLEGHK